MTLFYLRTLRERRKWTQAQLSLKSKIAQNTISKLETQPRADPVFTTVLALSSALRVDPARLRFGPDPRKKRRAA